MARQGVDLREKYLDYKSFYTREEKKLIYEKRFLPLTHENRSYGLWLKKCRDSGVTNKCDQVLYGDLIGYFPDDLLAKADIGSMSVGLEAGSPLADHKFTEMACKIPFDLKVRGGTTKYVFKKSLEALLPQENIYRKKMGFSIPLSKWFTGELKGYALNTLVKKGSITNQLFKAQEIVRMLWEHSVKKDFGPKLWVLLMLELWWEEHFE